MVDFKKALKKTTPAPKSPGRMSDDDLRAQGFAPFLRPEHCAEGEWLQLTGFNALFRTGTEQEQITCEVENENGNQFKLGIRRGSPDNRILFHALGKDWRQWEGSVQVTIATGKRPGANGTPVRFVNVKAADAHPPDWSEHEPPHTDDDR